MREMRVGDAFAASLDADQDGEEGLFYVWDEDQIDAALGDAARRFKATYDVTRGGNWEDRNVLRRITPRGSPDEEAGLAASRAKLFALREARTKPGRDDKVLADWNGLTIAALARASAVFDEPAWLRTARAAFDFILAKLRGADGRLLHAWREGHPGARALLDDYALDGTRCARSVRGERRARRPRGRTQACERGHRPIRRRCRRVLPHRARRRRRARRGGRAKSMTERRRRVSVCSAETFVRLWHLTDEARWGEAAEGLIRSVSGAPEGLGGSPLTLMSADMLARGGSIVIDGRLDDSGAKALAFAALRAPDSSLTVLRLDRRLWPNGPPRDDLPRAEDADRNALSAANLQPSGRDARGARNAHERGARGRSGLASLIGNACWQAKSGRQHDLSLGANPAARQHFVGGPRIRKREHGFRHAPRPLSFRPYPRLP